MFFGFADYPGRGDDTAGNVSTGPATDNVTAMAAAVPAATIEIVGYTSDIDLTISCWQDFDSHG